MDRADTTDSATDPPIVPYTNAGPEDEVTDCNRFHGTYFHREWAVDGGECAIFVPSCIANQFSHDPWLPGYYWAQTYGVRSVCKVCGDREELTALTWSHASQGKGNHKRLLWNGRKQIHPKVPDNCLPSTLDANKCHMRKVNAAGDGDETPTELNGKNAYEGFNCKMSHLIMDGTQTCRKGYIASIPSFWETDEGEIIHCKQWTAWGLPRDGFHPAEFADIAATYWEPLNYESLLIGEQRIISTSTGDTEAYMIYGRFRVGTTRPPDAWMRLTNVKGYKGHGLAYENQIECQLRLPLEARDLVCKLGEKFSYQEFTEMHCNINYNGYALCDHFNNQPLAAVIMVEKSPDLLLMKWINDYKDSPLHMQWTPAVRAICKAVELWGFNIKLIERDEMDGMCVMHKLSTGIEVAHGIPGDDWSCAWIGWEKSEAWYQRLWPDALLKWMGIDKKCINFAAMVQRELQVGDMDVNWCKKPHFKVVEA
jgi:hypothetical protein